MSLSVADGTEKSIRVLDAWCYAREMGLPINMIVMNDNGKREHIWTVADALAYMIFLHGKREYGALSYTVGRLKYERL